MQNILLVFIGGGAGAALRYGINGMSVRLLGSTFPCGTPAINVGGSFLMGLLVGWLALKGEHATPLRLLLATGVLGGFTTFSAFTLETIMLWERQQPGLAVCYVVLSVGLALIGLLAGLWLGRVVF